MGGVTTAHTQRHQQRVMDVTERWSTWTVVTHESEHSLKVSLEDGEETKTSREEGNLALPVAASGSEVAMTSGIWGSPSPGWEAGE